MSKKNTHLFVIAPIKLDDQSVPVTTIEVLRIGTIQDRGLEITKKMLEDYVANFKANVYGTELQINFEHNRGGEAAGWIKDLFVDGESLMATVEWTSLGAQKISGKLYKFISSELAPEYPRFDTGKIVSNVFIGAGLTNAPALKGQLPISLTEKEKQDFIHKTRTMFKKLMEDLKARASLTEADTKFARSLLADVSEEEKAAAEAEVAGLESKQKADEAAAEAAKTAETEKAKTEAAALAEKNKSSVSLSEFEALKEANQKLTDQVVLKELTEDVSKSLVLSNSVETGFLDEATAEVTKFMLSLSVEQRATFKSLVTKVKSVDFSTRGTSGGRAVVGSEDAVIALAETLLKEGKAKNIDEAQKIAMEQVGKK